MAGPQAQLFPHETKNGLGKPNYLRCGGGREFSKSGAGNFVYYGWATAAPMSAQWIDRDCRWNSLASIYELYDQIYSPNENDTAYNTFTFNIRSTQTGVIPNSGWTQMKITGSKMWYDTNTGFYYITPLVKTYNRTQANFGTGGQSGDRTAFWQWRGKANWAGFEPWRTAPPAGTRMDRVEVSSSPPVDAYSYPSIKIEWS